MSVAPSWRQLPYYRIPNRLRHLAPKASGSDAYACWAMGEGTFQAGHIAEGLTLRPDSPNHGVVEPAMLMTSDDFQDHLSRTRDLCAIDEA
jgi:hypothetical protein